MTLCWATREAPDDSSAEKRAPTSRREILRSKHMLRMVRHGALLVLLLALMVADPSSAADRETIRQHIATALALKDSKSWDDSIGEFRKVLKMRSAADDSTWAEATDGMNALCHGQYTCLPPDDCLGSCPRSGILASVLTTPLVLSVLRSAASFWLHTTEGY